MIRINTETVQNAKSLGLNISKICEDALIQAIKEETQPYEIVESPQIIFDAELLYVPSDSTLALGFTVTNTSEENVILDRINYVLDIKSDNSEKPIQIFKGTVLKRVTIRKGQGKHPFGERLKPSPELARILREKASNNFKDLEWRIVPSLYVNNKKSILKGRFKQILDETGINPRPRLIKIFP